MSDKGEFVYKACYYQGLLTEMNMSNLHEQPSRGVMSPGSLMLTR